MIEAVCGKCGETFIPHNEEPDDLIHGQTEAEEACGGVGVVAGEWIRPGTYTGHDYDGPIGSELLPPGWIGATTGTDDTDTPCADCGHLWAHHEGYRCTVTGCDCDD